MKQINDHAELPWVFIPSENEDGVCYDILKEEQCGFEYLGEFNSLDNAIFSKTACNNFYKMRELISEYKKYGSTLLNDKEAEELLKELDK